MESVAIQNYNIAGVAAVYGRTGYVGVPSIANLNVRRLLTVDLADNNLSLNDVSAVLGSVGSRSDYNVIVLLDAVSNVMVLKLVVDVCGDGLSTSVGYLSNGYRVNNNLVALVIIVGIQQIKGVSLSLTGSDESSEHECC